MGKRIGTLRKDEKIASIDFFCKRRLSCKILILSNRFPTPENRVEKSTEISLSGSPITCCFPFLKITAPDLNSCNSKALKSKYF